MTEGTSEIRLDVDLRNPGQFFACCGVLELAGRMWPGSEAWFEGRPPRAVFRVAVVRGSGHPLRKMIQTLCEAQPLVVRADDHEAYPQADRKPVVIVPFKLRLDWWLDSYRGAEKSELKVWAGQQTPERNLAALRESWRQLLAASDEGGASERLFQYRAPMSGRFGFDPSASWDALDVGFSPDEQGVPVMTSPATELLAAVGLQRCRPAPVEDRRRSFRWCAWRVRLDASVAAAAVVGVAQALAAYEFPVVMRNSQYGNFGWARPVEEHQ